MRNNSRQNKRVRKQDTMGQPRITQFMTKKRKTETTRKKTKKRRLDTGNDETQDATLDRGAGSGNDNEANKEKVPKERSRKKQNRT